MNELLYTVCCLPSILARQTIFFRRKSTLCSSMRPLLRRKTRIQHPVCETWRMPFIHYLSYVVLPLFHCCLRIVYSGLNGREIILLCTNRFKICKILSSIFKLVTPIIFEKNCENQSFISKKFDHFRDPLSLSRKQFG